MKIFKILITILFCIFWIAPTVHADDYEPLLKPQIAIIIDDFGNDMGGTAEMMDLPFPITVAVMPFLQTSCEDAKMAYQKGHEVIIHMPMEPICGKQNWLGPKPITTDLSDKEIKKRLTEAYEEIPYAIGMNNHMGSKVTSDERVMRLVMDFCAKNKLFFIDSATHHKSVAEKVAKEKGVICLKNQIFLDDVHTPGHVLGQLQEVKQEALENGISIAIGHVGNRGQITARALKKFYFTEKENDHIDYVPISELVKSAQ